jgi:K+-sensing histidine kinase KdpD
MNTIRIIVAIVTFIILLCCLAVTVVSLVSGQWMGAIVSFAISCIFGYFVYHDCITLFKKDNTTNEQR